MNKKISTVNARRLAQFEDQYVAFPSNRSKVLASGATIKDLEAKLKTLNTPDIVISYIPPISKYIAPICQ